MVFGYGESNVSFNFTPDPPGCHGNKICDKIGYNFACVRNFCEIFIPIGVSRGWAIECCQLHFPRPTPVAMATKFRTKLACVRDFCEIFAPTVFFFGGEWAIECCQLHSSPTDSRCHGNEIWDKIVYNLACVKNICEIFASVGGFSRMGH